MNAREIMAALARPFPADAISWRVGSTTADKSKGLALAYLDARDVAARLDEVLGLDWQCEYTPMPNGTCCCRIGIKVGDHWVWRSNGAGETDVEGEKGQYSSAFKRAAVLFGVGSYLYAVDSPWVALEQKGRTHVIAASEQGKLRAALSRAVGEPSSSINRPQPEPAPAPVREPAPPAPTPAPQSISARATAATQTPRAQPAMSAPPATRTAPAAPQNPVEAQSAGILQKCLDELYAADTLATIAAWDKWVLQHAPRLTDKHRSELRVARKTHRDKVYNRESVAA